LEAACLSAARTLLSGQPLQPQPGDTTFCAVLPAGAAVLRQFAPTIYELHRLAAKGRIRIGSKLLLREVSEHVRVRGGKLLLAASALPTMIFYRKHMKELAKEPCQKR